VPSQSPQKITWAIPSDHKAARKVQKAILTRIRGARFDGHSIFAINLALEEAMINAIKHGNKFDKDRRVHIGFALSPRQAEITVEDEGEGFNRKSVPDPTLPENLCKSSGRGILLIEAYMDRVQYTHGGRRLRMIKRNETARPAKTRRRAEA